jgi:hypothetical protein
MAIAACFVFQREISRSVFWDFFDSIGPFETCHRISWIRFQGKTGSEERPGRNDAFDPQRAYSTSVK